MTAKQASERRLTVVQLIATNFFGGPERQILGYATHADPAAVRVVIISFVERGGNELLARAAEKGIETLGLPARGPFDWSPVRALKSWLRTQPRPLVVVAHGYKADVVGRLSTLCPRVPCLAVVRGTTRENWRIRAYQAIDWLTHYIMDGLIAVSEAKRRELARRGLGRKTVVVPNAAPSEGARLDEEGQRRLRDELGLSAEEFVVLCAGRLSPEKGQVHLLDAVSRLLAGGTAMRVLLAGDGPERERLASRVRRLGLGGVVTLLGFRRDIDALLAICDCVVLPSLSEGLPNILLEAFAAGRPAVASAVGGVPELVRSGETGWLVPSGDPDALADALADCAADRECCRLMGDRARRLVRSQYSRERQVEHLTRIFAAAAARESIGGLTP